MRITAFLSRQVGQKDSLQALLANLTTEKACNPGVFPRNIQFVKTENHSPKISKN